MTRVTITPPRRARSCTCRTSLRTERAAYAPPHRQGHADRDGAAPSGPSLERVAADLRRLIAEHERVRRSPELAGRAGRLAVLEGAVSDCALDAARSLELSPPDRDGRAPLRRDQLAELSDQLADTGLVLPVRGTWTR